MNIPFLTFILVFFLISCNNSIKNDLPNSTDILLEIDTNNKKLASKTIVDTILVDAEYDSIILGDLNFDNINDTGIVYTPAYYYIIENSTEKSIDYFYKTIDGSYDNIISFSNNFPKITVENSLWADVKMVADINNDGICEILVLKSWYHGCWNKLSLYSYIKNQWKLITFSDIHACSEGDFSKRIIKKGKKYFFIGTKTVEGDFIDDTISIQLSEFE